ncbi:MAG: TetR family transcriptional regulator protein [Gammaproteobacteria bacterium]|nr:TetR family transcriptional regulator protein [Gammaproteobacteria bacterium]
MAQSKPNETRGRGSAEKWLEGAYESLVQSGIDSVRITPLAKKLNLARTSFYWFFEDRDTLLASLIERWRSKNTGNLIKQADCYAESISEAILNVFDCWVNVDLFDSRFEVAVRGWAQQSVNVAREIKAADDARLAALQRMFLRFGYEPLPADVRARTLYLTQIGYISIKSKEDLKTRMNRMADYVGVFSGVVPQQREMNRFFSRHGHTPRGADVEDAQKLPSPTQKRVLPNSLAAVE